MTLDLAMIYWLWHQKYRQQILREFPGGLVIGIPGFHCFGPGSIPSLGTEIPQAAEYGQKNNHRQQPKTDELDFIKI